MRTYIYTHTNYIYIYTPCKQGKKNLKTARKNHCKQQGKYQQNKTNSKEKNNKQQGKKQPQNKQGKNKQQGKEDQGSVRECKMWLRVRLPPYPKNIFVLFLTFRVTYILQGLFLETLPKILFKTNIKLTFPRLFLPHKVIFALQGQKLKITRKDS